jgi:hypothetical protein
MVVQMWSCLMKMGGGATICFKVDEVWGGHRRTRIKNKWFA